MSHLTLGSKAGGRKCRILGGALRLVAESDALWSKVSHLTWGPKASGRKCRILRGVRLLVVKSVAFYVGS